MFTGSLLAIIVIVFLLVLLIIALLGDRMTLSEPYQYLVYSLALGIHCTTWAMFGTISQASQYGWSLIPTYLGMILAMIIGFSGLKKIAKLCIQHNIASLADFMSIRFNHSFGLPALVTLVCVVGVTPYIALQLDSISSTAQILLPTSTLVTDNVNWFVALSMAAFALFFGTRSKSLSPKHPGLLLLVAFTSLVKLLAMSAIALWVCYGLFDGVYDLVRQAVIHPIANQSLSHDFEWFNYSVYVFLGVVSMYCLPRQFHITFVELPQLQALQTARWILPLYLLCMSVGVLPIALAGNIMLAPQDVSSDSFTIALPLYFNQSLLTILAFIGGLAAAMAMIIVSTLALGIMIGNNIATPLYFLIRQQKATQRQPIQLHGSTILWLRRATVVAVLIGAYFYHIHISQTMPLVNSGFIALALIAQLFPSFVLSNLLPRPPASAPIISIISGSIGWYLWVLQPSLIDTLIAEQLARGLILALAINVGLYMLICSIYWIRNKSEQDHNSIKKNDLTNLFIRTCELKALCQRLLPGRDIDSLFKAHSQDDYVPHPHLVQILSLVANQVGFATAKLLFNTIADSPDNDFNKGEWIAQTHALTQAKDSAIRENDLKTKFLAAAGHDLMQPFNAAQLFASILANKNTDPELQPATQGLLQSLDNAETYLTMLLDITKLESGVIKPNIQPFYLDDMLAPLLSEFSIIAQQANINLRYVPTKHRILSDKLLLKRIVQNLLANAIRYTGLHHQMHPSSNNKVLIGVRKQSNSLALWICDTGPGIPKEKQTEIFGEFTQLHNASNKLGLGLGLTIVEKMAQLLQHPLSVVSEIGRGSGFSILLPLIQTPSVPPASLPQQSNAHKIGLQKVNATRLLLIENDPQVTQAMNSLLSDWGYVVTTISSQIQALELSFETLAEIDIIICDYHLDLGENGLDVYSSIVNQLKASHKAIVTTADRSVEIREAASQHGMLYLPKPIKPIALKHLLQR